MAAIAAVVIAGGWHETATAAAVLDTRAHSRPLRFGQLDAGAAQGLLEIDVVPVHKAPADGFDAVG